MRDLSFSVPYYTAFTCKTQGTGNVVRPEKSPFVPRKNAIQPAETPFVGIHLSLFVLVGMLLIGKEQGTFSPADKGA